MRWDKRRGEKREKIWGEEYARGDYIIPTII